MIVTETELTKKTNQWIKVGVQRVVVVIVTIVNTLVLVKTLSLLFVLLLTISCSKALNPLDEIERKIDEAHKKEIVLTESEKELVKEATEKEWNDLDK